MIQWNEKYWGAAPQNREEALRKFGWNEVPMIAWNEKLWGDRPVTFEEKQYLRRKEIQIKNDKRTYYQQKSLDNFKLLQKIGISDDDRDIHPNLRKCKFDPVDMEFEKEKTKQHTYKDNAYWVYGLQQYKLLNTLKDSFDKFNKLKKSYLEMKKVYKDDTTFQSLEELLETLGDLDTQLKTHISIHGKIIVLPIVDLEELEMPNKKKITNKDNELKLIEMCKPKLGESSREWMKRIKKLKQEHKTYASQIDEIAQDIQNTDFAYDDDDIVLHSNTKIDAYL